ncbi:MAG: hypothetical protein MRY83_05520 [Flavobacteriales bacterium]|nr:hypothetical protein [Flavobacteriales bacterium]
MREIMWYPLHILPDWALYNLPNGLWTFSYVLFIYCIWKKVDRKVLFYMSVIPFLGVFSELLQFFGIIVGKSDLLDVALYTLGGVIAYGISMLHNRIFVSNEIK